MKLFLQKRFAANTRMGLLLLGSTLFAASQAGYAQVQNNIIVPNSQENLPNVALTDQILFQTLSAEVAAQRGQIGPAYGTLMALANNTHDPRFAKRAAEIAWTHRYGEDAISATRLWHTISPQSEEAFQTLQAMLVATGKLQDLQTICTEQYLHFNTDQRVENLLHLERLLVRAPEKSATLNLFDKLSARDTQRFEVQLILARVATMAQEFGRAQTAAQTALKLNPQSEPAALILAQLYQPANPEQSTQVLRDFLSRNPQAVEARLALLRSLLNQKAVSQAQTEFEILDQQANNKPRILLSLAVLNLQINKPSAAEQYLKRYLGLIEKQKTNAPPNPIDNDDINNQLQAFLTLAQIAEERNDFQTAYNWLSQVDITQRTLLIDLRRAQLLAKLDRVNEARELIKQLSNANTAQNDQVQIIQTEAQILRDTGRQQEAFRLLGTAITNNHNQPELLYDYAMVAEKLNQLDVMEDALRKVIQLKPQNQHAYNALGYSLADRNIRLPEAFSLIEKALSLAPNDAFILDSMGWVHYKMGNINQSLSYIQQAFNLKPDPEIAAHLGELLWETGQHSEAQKCWRDALKRDPKNETLLNVIKRYKLNY